MHLSLTSSPTAYQEITHTINVKNKAALPSGSSCRTLRCVCEAEGHKCHIQQMASPQLLNLTLNASDSGEHTSVVSEDAKQQSDDVGSREMITADRSVLEARDLHLQWSRTFTDEDNYLLKMRKTF